MRRGAWYPGRVHDLAQMAWRFEASQQWERLLETAQAWLAEEPDNARAHLHAARAKLHLDRAREALSHVAVVLRQQPDNAHAFQLSSAAKLECRDFLGAEQDIRRAIELESNDADHWVQLAWICHQHQDKASGLRWATKAHELRPNSSHVLNLLAICQPDTAAGRALRAKYTADALALHPNSAELLNNQGLISLNERRYAEAEALFRRSLAIDPRSKIARSNLLRAIRKRDPIYRIISAPIAGYAALQASRRSSGGRIVYWVLFLLIVFTGFGSLVCLLVVVILCLLLPVVKLYEYITVGDLRAQAGEIGARRGGFLGFRRWPFAARISLFAAATLVFWFTCYRVLAAAERHDRTHPGELGWIPVLIFVPILIFGLQGWGRIFIRQANNWRRAYRLRKLPHHGRDVDQAP